MKGQESKLLIKIGQTFEANAIGNVAIGSVVVIVIALIAAGFSFH